MSAPIDDLLYGGDDSGDEDEMTSTVPMPAFGSAPMMAAPVAVSLPLTAGIPPALAASKPTTTGLINAVPPTSVSAMTNATGSAPLGVGGIGMKPTLTGAPLGVPNAVHAATGTANALRQPPLANHPTASQPLKPPGQPPVAAPAPVKQTPGSGQQMFQQMFALLKQMLSPEQYAQFYAEMRSGNGNDIKSIMDIIKRIAGDAIFSSLIQKLELSRSFPAAATTSNANAVKTEPVGGHSAATTASPTSRPLVARTAGLPATTTATAATPATSMPVVAVTGAAISPGLTGRTGVPAVTTQRPTLAQAQKPLSIEASATAGSVAPASALLKSEPPQSTTTTPSPASTTSTATSPAAASKNEQLEKIQFAKKLLFHASTCTLSPGVCQVKKCDDVRRVFKHSASCGGARSCTHCEQLKGLVKYHAKECQVAANDHCAIPFCDALRRAYISAAAATSAAKSKSSLSTMGVNGGAGGAATSRAGMTSDDDDDNTPLSSAVSKAKKNSAKAKSPKASPTVRTTNTASPATSTSSSSAASKKKGATISTAAKPPGNAASTAAAATSAASGAAAAAANKPVQAAKPAVTANMTVEYGRLLQLILHVQKCTTTACPVGEECAEAKSLLRQINSPNAPARAKTYKQVYAHHKVCIAKNNTANCPMCKIGMRPIIIPTDTSPIASPGSQSTAAGSSGTAGVNSGAAASGSSSPSAASSKRSNSTVTPSPRSPSKKQRTGGNSRAKAAAPLPDPAAQGGAEQSGHDLIQAGVADIRKEADVLTHTSIDLSSERRTMMDGALRRRLNSEHLPCKKEEWVEKDLFNSAMLRNQMRDIGRRCGVQLGNHTNEVMSYALHEYLKQVIEEMVEISKQRCDLEAQTLEQLQKSEDDSGTKHVELTATDILRVSCEDSFSRLRQEDLALRSRLLEDAKREELAEKERAKKRKKVDRSKLNQEEKDEAEMDIEELAVKDLKDRLLQEDKDGVVKVDGRVNESISTKFTRKLDNQVTMEDATYWLQNQKPYISPKLFVRAEAARIVTKSLI